MTHPFRICASSPGARTAPAKVTKWMKWTTPRFHSLRVTSARPYTLCEALPSPSPWRCEHLSPCNALQPQA